MTPQEVLAENALNCKALVTRFLAGFDDTNRVAQAEHLPNHASWTLGHIALYLHRGAERIDGVAMPESDWVTGDGTAGSAQRYDTESVCYGSTPVADAARYPTLARGRAIFEAACDRLAATVRTAAWAKLCEEVEWGPSKKTLRALAMHVTFHCGLHAGQLMDLRRALGMGRVVG